MDFNESSQDTPTSVYNPTSNTKEETPTSSGSDLTYKADYNDLDDGATLIEQAVKDINENINECNKIIKEIFTDSTFLGPFADYCYGTWNDLSELTYQSNSVLDTSAKVLENSSTAYKESDKAAQERIGSV